MREEKDDVVELKVDEAVSRVSHFAGIGRVNIKDRRRKLAKVRLGMTCCICCALRRVEMLNGCLSC